jgi:hypothetical protein
MEDMEEWPEEFKFARAEDFEHNREWMNLTLEISSSEGED